MIFECCPDSLVYRLSNTRFNPTQPAYPRPARVRVKCPNAGCMMNEYLSSMYGRSRPHRQGRDDILTLIIVELILVKAIHHVVNLDDIGVRLVCLKTITRAIEAQNQAPWYIAAPFPGCVRRAHDGDMGLKNRERLLDISPLPGSAN